uniref:Uncharacterized protein n=1 Tax=Anguilla anguilla TaxID=7936 RepID=A0A0E9PNP8_ANGAN
MVRCSTVSYCHSLVMLSVNVSKGRAVSFYIDGTSLVGIRRHWFTNRVVFASPFFYVSASAKTFFLSPIFCN